MDTHAVIADVPALARLQRYGLVAAFWGILAGLVGLFLDADQFFRSWLVGFLFCLGLSLGPLALLMLQHLSGGHWGLAGRRVFEAASRNIPFVALLFVPLAFGLPRLYTWAQPGAGTDHVVQQKALYLNVPFFLGRAILYFVIWSACSWLLNSWSAAQDRGEVAVHPSDTRRFRTVSAPGLLVYVITMTFASVDWIMSLDPHWYSTIFGLIFVVSQGLAGLALVISVLALLLNVEPYASYLRPGLHFLDLGKLLLAFVMLWAYLSFSQLLIIWSGNLPEEITFYANRFRGGWQYVSLLVLSGHFALPFVLLLSRDLKRRPRLLAQVAIWILVMRVVDLIWYVEPMFPHGRFPIHWMDVALPVGLAGIWLFLFARNLRSRALLPLNDPFFKEALAHDAH